MTTNAGHIEKLVTRIQSEFLDTPSLRLTLPQATRRFAIDRISCEAVLGALVDAGVLARSEGGTYTRFFPRLAEAA
jgi:hypothetical protein